MTRYGFVFVCNSTGNVQQLSRFYGFAKDEPTGVKLAMEAGLDQNMGGQYATFTKGLVLGGNLSNETLDRAVGNILRKKFASGLFDMPPTDPAGIVNIGTPEHQALAREAARQGLTLLINRNNTLPINMATVRNVAVIGELAGCGAHNDSSCIAKFSMLGGYQSGGVQVASIEDAFRERGYNTTWALGTPATNGQTPNQASAGIAEAIELVASSDLTVMAVGCIACTCCDRCGCGEAGDRQSFDLEGQQLALLNAVIDASRIHNTRLVIVTICGRPVTFGEGNAVLDQVQAMVSSFRPGQEGGRAIADLIVGDYNPGGRLAQNWLRSVGQIFSPANPWYQYKWGSWFENGDRTPISPLFPIGHGLSYTTFNVSSLAAPSSVTLGTSGGPNAADKVRFNVTVTVSNTGTRDGPVTVFATYYKQTDGTVRWARMLCGFVKINVAAGDTVQASVEIEVADLARWDPDATRVDLLGNAVRGAYVVDGGEHELQVDQCIDSGVSYGVSTHACNPLQTTVTIGESGRTYTVL